MGDATNLVLILGGELLKKAENLLIMGLHPSEVIKGYELASSKAQAELESTLSFLSLAAVRCHFDSTSYTNPWVRCWSGIAVVAVVFREPPYTTAS